MDFSVEVAYRRLFKRIYLEVGNTMAENRLKIPFYGDRTRIDDL